MPPTDVWDVTGIMDGMSVGTAMTSWFRRTGAEILGWLLVLVGIPLMPLPGPGTIVLVSGVALLSRQYVWAQRILDPLQRKAVEAARYGVATWPRVFLSFLGGVWLVLLGVLWWRSPEIPEVDLPDVTLPAGLVSGAFVTGVVLFTLAAVVVVALLLRGRDLVRAGFVVAVTTGVLLLATRRTPDLSALEIELSLGPQLPAAGWGTAVGLWVSAVAAWVLLAWSVRRYREPVPEPDPAHSNV